MTGRHVHSKRKQPGGGEKNGKALTDIFRDRRQGQDDTGVVASIRDRDTDGEEQTQFRDVSERGSDNTDHEAAQSSETAEPEAGVHDLHIPELHEQVAHHRGSVLRVHVLGETPQAGAQASRLHSQNTGTVQTTAEIKGTRDRMGEIMTRDLLIHKLQMMRDVCKKDHLETETEALDAAIWALETQEQLKQERDAAMKLAAESGKDGKVN